MPKCNTERITEIQRHRQTVAKKYDKYVPGTVYIQVLGSGANGVPNSLFLFTDQKRYLFNCGESTQRLSHEHKVKLSRLEHIFITSKTWKNIGGLPGLSLTLQDVGIPYITLHGPEGLDELYPATKRFVIMKEMDVLMAKCNPNEDFEDNVMSVKYVLLGPHESLLAKDVKPAAKKPKLEVAYDSRFDQFLNDDTDYYKADIRNLEAKGKSGNKDKQRNSPEKDPAKKKNDKVLHELQNRSHCSVAYICTLKKRPGTLDLAKCVEYGIKPGPILGQLKSGQDVVLPDGTLVLSKNVKTPDDPGPVFIVLEVPDISYLKEKEFSAHFDNGENSTENIPTLIVHFTPPHVMSHPIYRSFMSKFGPTTQHMVLNSQNTCLGSEAVHRTQHKLHLLDSDIFPLLKDVSIPAVWHSQPPVPKTNSPIRMKGLEELKNKIALAQFQNIINIEGSCKGDASAGEDPDCKLNLIAPRALTIFHLRPKRQLDRSMEPKLHIQEYIQEAMDADGFVSSLEQFRHLVEEVRYKNGAQKEFPKVVFLGTGSCIPSKTRNTSGIALQIDENRSMLLDCGEGTHGQLVRFYGPKKVNSFLRTLKAIYISHLHADHHIGLIGVLQARQKAFEEVSQAEKPDPLYLMAPGQIVSWLTMYDHQFERICQHFELIPNQSLLYNAFDSSVMSGAMLANLGVSALRTCLVSHCPNAFGVCVEIPPQHKITYSGDTIPCEELVKLGENSTLLIHEATMEDQLEEEARVKMHSTTSQALDIGRQMGARHTLLTHFSQRYARLPRLHHEMLNAEATQGIAFDNMQVTMSDLELLSHMYAPLQLMFAEHCVDMELKAANRARQKEKKTSASQEQIVKESNSRTSRTEKRKCSQSQCRVVSSAPQARYRESNASRLRQEMKGMAVSGVVWKVSRSKSSSPTKLPSRPRTGSVTPHRRQSVSPEKPSEVAVKPTVATSKNSSNASSRSTIPGARMKAKKEVSSAQPQAQVIDTRSKTLNTVTRPPSKEEVKNTNNRTVNKRKPIEIQPPTSRFNSGYGKPLVTPLNKKLTIRRELANNMKPNDISPNVEKNQSQGGRMKSPVGTWKAEVQNHSPKVVDKKRDTSKLKSAKAVLSSNKVHATTPRKQEIQHEAVKNFHTANKSKNSSPIYNRTRSSKEEFPRSIKNCNAAHGSNRSFKPQLEDIKSSFLLLNKNDQDKNKTEKRTKFDENQRKHQLLQAKSKYQSKKFLNDALYDKIEGLNWISWK